MVHYKSLIRKFDEVYEVLTSISSSFNKHFKVENEVVTTIIVTTVRRRGKVHYTLRVLKCINCVRDRSCVLFQYLFLYRYVWDLTKDVLFTTTHKKSIPQSRGLCIKEIRLTYTLSSPEIRVDFSPSTTIEELTTYSSSAGLIFQ